jgi:hypothetical protein
VEHVHQSDLSALVMLNVLARSRGGEVQLDGASRLLVRALADSGLHQLLVITDT